MTMRTFIIRSCLVAGLAGVLYGCSFDVPDHRDLSKFNVQQAVDKIRTDLEKDLGGPVPSFNVLIQTPTQRIFVSSVPAGSTPVLETSNYRFASVTKHFTATAIMNMNEKHWLDYEAHITDLIPGTNTPYVPDTPAWNFPYKKDITIEQLLQHMAGVYDVDNDSVPGFNGKTFTEATQLADPTHQFSTDEMVQQLILHNLYYWAPGGGYHYSNTGYSILGKIIERVYSAKSGSAKTYGDYMQDYIVGSTAVVPIAIHFPEKASDTALPFPRVEGTVRELTKTVVYGDYNMTAQIAEGNGFGTMAALNTYIRTLMKGQNVLTPASVDIMQQKNLGGYFTKNLGYGKNGARIGNLSLIAYDPQTDVSVVSYIALWDLTQGPDGSVSFLKCKKAIEDAAYAARGALGFPNSR